MNITNKDDISLPMAVFLLHDEYDYDHRENVISATTLMKPLKAIILARQNLKLVKMVDLRDLIPSTMGNALHSWNEKAWMSGSTVLKALKVKGVSDKVISRIRINPDPDTVVDGDLVIYVEKRSEKRVGNWIVVGKFDLCTDGQLADLKSCSVWSEIYDSNSEDYTLQGSIYKWLNPDIVNENSINIEKMFTDWSAVRARQGGGYPASRVVSRKYPLMSIDAIEIWIKERLDSIDNLISSPQEELPVCSKEELWQSDNVWKYYKKVGAKRATKNYDNQLEAETRLGSDGGEVKFFPGEVKRCRYCNVVDVCDQAQGYLSSGQLTL